MKNAAITIVYKFLREHMFSVFLGKYLSIELLGHMETLRLTFEELPNCFLKWLYRFIFPLAMNEGSNFFTSQVFLKYHIFVVFAECFLLSSWIWDQGDE